LHDFPNTEAPVIFIGRKGSCGALKWSSVPSFGIDTVYFVDRRHTSAHLRWLYWAFHVLGLEVTSQDTGVPGLAREVAYEAKLPLPPPSEQSVIAAFLDRETAKIDALVEEQRRLIELLKEKRQAVISHAVTKGLDPNASMKDSGVRWLGKLPGHWDLKRLKHVSPEITVGIVVEPSKYYCDAGVPALRSLNVRPGCITHENLVYISKQSNEVLSKSKLRAGDLVAVRTGQPGTTAVVPQEFDGANCIDLIIIRRPMDGSQRYLCWYLASEAAAQQFAEGSGGAIQQHFNIGTAMNLLVPWPPLSEQTSLVEFIDGETGKIDALVREAESTTTLLQERRSALISAAVTGKIDVRGQIVEAEAPRKVAAA
jgi:type I restriction enzyme S subunit